MGLFTMGSGADLAESVTKDSQASARGYSNLLNSYLAQTRSALMPYLSGGGQGFDPLQLALMKSGLLNNVGQMYGNANSQVMNALQRRGSAGQGPVGGDYTRAVAALQGGAADTASRGLSGVDQANLGQALSNKVNALNLMQGGMGQINNALGSFNQLTGSALGDYVKAMGQSFGGQMMGQMGGALGKGVGAGLSGGLGTFMSGLGSGNFGW